MIRLLLIDDHAIVREGFKRLFDAHADIEVVGEAGSATEAARLAESLTPDVAIVDLSLGGDSGLNLLPNLRRLAPGMRSLVVSMHHDAGFVARALENGADGYVTKGAAASALVDHVRRLHAGERVLSEDLAPASQHRPRLSDREMEVLRGLMTGAPPKAIAADLGISDKTLYRHRANVMEKLGVQRTHDLVRVALEQGLLTKL